MKKPTEKQVYFLNFFFNEGWLTKEQLEKGELGGVYCFNLLKGCFDRLNKGVASELSSGAVSNLRGNIADLGSLRLFHNSDDITIARHFSHL